jgi:uncharacterized Zn finger protein (UPF0148 family)
MYIECAKCGHGFSTDILGKVFCPKCGAENKNESLRRDQYLSLGDRVERALVDYSRCTSSSLRRNDKQCFERTLSHLDNPRVTTYIDDFSKIQVRMSERRITFYEALYSDGAYKTFEVKTHYSEPGAGINSIGENTIEIVAFDIIDMTDAEIVEYVNKAFKAACWMGITRKMDQVTFFDIWNNLSHTSAAVSNTMRVLCKKGESDERI